ncbi:MAG: thiamine pyrophosphate-binding protein [Pseudomonadota bacterium]
MEKKKVVGTGGELLMHQLVAQGVKYAFANTGSAEAGFYDAFLTVPGVQPILLMAESLVLSAADGYAKASGKAAFVNVHLAAGTRQGSGQLQNAYFDGSPMVVTAGMREPGTFGDHNTLGASSGFSQMGAVEDITKKRWEVTDARGIPMATRRAFKDALTMPTGPVYLAFSSPALDAKNVEGTIKAAHALEMAQVPNGATIQKMHDALLNAKRPLLIVGPEVRAAGAGRELLALAENYALPTAVGFYDYGSFPPKHPCYIGMILDIADSGYDVVCCVGYRQNTRSIPKDELFTDAETIIAIGHDPALLGNTFALDLDVWGNVRHTLTALNSLWKQEHSNLDHIQKRKRELAAQSKARLTSQTEEALKLSKGKPIHPVYLGDSMARILAKNTLMVSENFRAAEHLMPFGYGDNDWRLLRTYGGSLGYGPGAAVGARLGAPDRPVVLSIGDGSVMYSASAFWTMARYSLPILTVIWNNLQYQTVRENFASWGGSMKAQNKYPETFLGDPAIDYVMLAKAQGIEGMHVREPGELDAALTRGREAQAAGQPFVLDVHIANVGAGANQSWYMPYSLSAAR